MYLRRSNTVVGLFWWSCFLLRDVKHPRPEAELLVSRLGRGDFQLEMPVIVLAFHVDYGDYMGWKDPYGGSQWTVRQKAYVESLKLDTMFTPQIVVQGRTQCVGNEEEALLSSIVNAPRFPAPAFQVRFLTLFLSLCFLLLLLLLFRPVGMDLVISMQRGKLIYSYCFIET
ncbi:hypothetical protein NC651_004076 [Populus alba x Populus x berolinensis]|nr:hypothetical protein NC651_004076 [Populus alba x Populus x berolinensis]